ncbi:hypothetical protein FHR22_003340 [Sphingopyxis panaciterrae]|nr:hypothetical protein [Sphingopyxis panaciterrae]NIJ38616.1 hypothetical protein [Sphingopyxis panaciterrae]
MRIPPIAPPRRPVSSRREPFETPALPGPTPGERRLIDRLMRRAGYRDTR